MAALAWLCTVNTTMASSVYTTATTIFLLVRLQNLLSKETQSPGLNSINNNRQLHKETADLSEKKDS